MANDGKAHPYVRDRIGSEIKGYPHIGMGLPGVIELRAAVAIYPHRLRFAPCFDNLPHLHSGTDASYFRLRANLDTLYRRSGQLRGHIILINKRWRTDVATGSVVSSDACNDLDVESVTCPPTVALAQENRNDDELDNGLHGQLWLCDGRPVAHPAGVFAALFF